MPITTTVSTQKPSQVKSDVLLLPVHEKEPLESLPAATRRALAAALRRRNFTGSWASAEMIVSPGRLGAEFVAPVGLGSPDNRVYRQLEGLRRGAAKIVQNMRRHALREIAVVLPDEGGPAIAAAALEAILLTNYRFDEYQKSLREEQEARSVRKITFIAKREQAAAVREAIAEAHLIMEGVTLTRDLVNQPASHMAPEILVETAREIEKKSQRIDLTVMDRNEAEREGFSAFLAVARGSEEEPYVMHLSYSPPPGIGSGRERKKIFLVGKGITFDSGGLSLKPASSMESMKIDMAGAAVVLGVFSLLAKLNLDVEVHGLVAACENMPSGKAFRPGDVVPAKNGKTIEILNTDAEGRVTLADTLSYAVEQKPDMIIDLATLTGAVVVALGETHAGVWSNQEFLRQGLMEAAEVCGEGLVSLPLPEEYKPMIRSKVADVKNTASNHPYGGAMTAALFLQEFVSDTPWAHIDIAGPSYSEKQLLPYHLFGGTGYGVRTIVQFLQHLDKEAKKPERKT